jgi:hypothetical protein
MVRVESSLQAVFEPQAARSYSWTIPPRMSRRRIMALAYGSERSIGVVRPIPRWGRAVVLDVGQHTRRAPSDVRGKVVGKK